MTGENKTVYKLVVTVNDRMFSAVARVSSLEIEYKFNEIIKPRIGLIMAFDNQYHARLFRDGFERYRYKILECDACIKEIALPGLLTDEDMWGDKPFKFWKWILHPEVGGIPNFGRLHYIPPGTVFCESITPRRIVE